MMKIVMSMMMMVAMTMTDGGDDFGDDDEGSNGDGVDRQLVRMGYRFLVRGCKGL